TVGVEQVQLLLAVIGRDDHRWRLGRQPRAGAAATGAIGGLLPHAAALHDPALSQALAAFSVLALVAGRFLERLGLADEDFLQADARPLELALQGAARVDPWDP